MCERKYTIGSYHCLVRDGYRHGREVINTCVNVSILLGHIIAQLGMATDMVER